MDFREQIKKPSEVRAIWYRYRPYIGGIKFLGILLATSGLIAWIFYDSILGMVVVIPLYPILGIIYARQMMATELSILRSDFKEILVLLSSFMQAGESMEQALYSTEKRLLISKTCSKKSIRALHRLNQRIGVNISLEEAIEEFAAEINIDEAYEFSNILAFAKRTGGNYNYQVKRSATKIEEKLALLSDISIMMAEKVLEMKVMIAMPVAVIAYIKFTSYDFISGMYHNISGVFAMSVALAIYAFMAIIGFKITDIKV